MRIACLVKRWDHHTPSGGYDRLATALGARAIERVGSFDRNSPIGAAWAWHRAGMRRYLVDYRWGDRLAELRALARGLLAPPDILHVLYGDEQLDLLLRYRHLVRCPLVVTFHIPHARALERFERYQPGLGRRIDAAVVLCRSEVGPFERVIGEGKVVFIPHGVDTTAFTPAEDGGPPSDNGDRLRLTFVGESIRHWGLIHRVIDACNQRALGVDFTIVSGAHCRPYFTGCDNIDFRSAVPEAELRDLYRSADAVFLPVTDATANNSALEALACGTPVISTNVGGIPDYVAADCGWLLPLGDVEGALQLIAALKADRSLIAMCREPARAQALTMDWTMVADQMRTLYRGLLAGQAPADAMAGWRTASTAAPAAVRSPAPSAPA